MTGHSLNAFDAHSTIAVQSSAETESEEEDNTGREDADTSESSGESEEDDDAEATLSAIAAARGLILQEQNASDDDESVEYPFDAIPKSLEDVANFILSDKCKSILVLAGAGMSVASGIPDFRSADGLYATLNADLLTANKAEKEAIRSNPTVAFDQDMFLQNPLPCLELQREFILGTRARRWKATLAHRFIELLHTKTGKLVRHYTQNIDGLEDQCTQLPRDKVIAVHGSMHRAECALCNGEANFDEFCDQVHYQIKDLSGKDQEAPKNSKPIVCKVCGYAAMKPTIVLFRSSLPKLFFESVPKDIKDVDLLIVIGTSLSVAPACSLVYRVPKSAMRVLVNREKAGDHLGLVFDEDVATRDYFAQGECDAVLVELMDYLGWIEDVEPLLLNEQLPDVSARLLEEYIRQRADGSVSEASSSSS
jgi:NAD+-dependent protein deacetylase sirtuin 2